MDRCRVECSGIQSTNICIYYFSSRQSVHLRKSQASEMFVHEKLTIKLRSGAKQFPISLDWFQALWIDVCVVRGITVHLKIDACIQAKTTS